MTHPARAKWLFKGAKTWISWWHEESRHQRWRNNLVVGSQSPSSLIHLQLPVSICLAWGRVINHWEYSFYPSPIIHVIFIFLSRPVSAHWRGRAGPWLPNVKISCQGSTWIWFMYYHTNSLSSPHCPAPLTAHRWDRVLIKCPFLSQNSNFHTILLTRLIPYSDHKKSVRNCSFSPVFKCLTHFACQVLTLLDNEKFKKVALFIANQQQATFCCKLFNKNHVST